MVIDSTGSAIVGTDNSVLRYNKAAGYYVTAHLSDPVMKIIVDASNNFYTVGYRYSGSNSSFVVSKYNSSVALLWQHTWNPSGYPFAQGFDIAFDAAGNVWAAGSTTSGGTTAGAVVGYNASGTLLIGQSLSGIVSRQYATSAFALLPSGTLYLTTPIGTYSVSALGISAAMTSWQGNFMLYDTTSHYMFFVWQEGGGNVAVTVATSSFTETTYLSGVGALTGFKQDSLGNVVLSGWDSSGNVFIQKMNSSGSVVWTDRFAPAAGYEGLMYGLAFDSSNNIYVCGWFYGVEVEYLTEKLSSAGALQWSTTYDGPPNNGYDYAMSVAVDSLNQIWVTGSIQIGSVSYPDTIVYQ